MMRTIPNQGHVFEGHDTPRAALLDQVRAHLIGTGMHPLDVDDRLIDRPGLVARAWWGPYLAPQYNDVGELIGEELAEGFVQEHHDGAQPVTVVHAGWEA